MRTSFLDNCSPFTAIVTPLAGYLLGCLCAGWYLVRLRMGKDIRMLGSGTVGAKNAGRLLGPWGFAATLLGDAVKGALAVWLARHFTGDERMELLAGAGAIIGHIWPAQLGFRGGKGMSTALGALLVFDSISALAYGALAVVLLALLRSTVLGGLLAVALMPAVLFARGASAFTVTGSAFVAALILSAHRKNLAAELAVLRGRCQHRDIARPESNDE